MFTSSYVIFSQVFTYLISSDHLFLQQVFDCLFARNWIYANGYDVSIHKTDMVLYCHGMYIMAEWTNIEYLTIKSIL